MSFDASVGVGFRTLRVNPLRTGLSTLGIVIGVASLVAVLALGDGFERYAREQIEHTTDLQVVVVQPLTTRDLDGQRIPRSDYPIFTATDAESVAARVPGVGAVSMLVTGPGLVSRMTSGAPRAALVSGVLPDAARLRDMRFSAGRFFTPEEARDRARVVVLSNRLARELGNVVPGDSVRLQGGPRVVTGVLEAYARERALEAYVPLGTAADAMVPTVAPRAPTMIVKAGRVEDVPTVKRAVEGWLAARYGDWHDRVTIGTREGRVEQVQQGMLVFKLFMGAIAGISLVVGGVGIMNVLLASVMERTREIGVRKAAGARARDILVQFLAESVAITGVGSALGAALGLGGAFAITALIRARSQAPLYAAFAWSTLGVAALAALVVGVAFGTYPALRAARLSPIDAIRHE